MKATSIETLWGLFIVTAVLLSLVAGFITILLLSQRRRLELQRRQMEEIQRSEEKYRNLFQNSVVGIMRCSLTDGHVLEANDAFLKILGVASLTELGPILPFDSPAERERFGNVLTTGHAVEDFETQLRRSDGSTIWISFSGKQFPGDGYLEGVVVDVTARKHAQEQIEEQAALLGKAQDAIIVCTLEHAVRYWNKSAERLFGWGAHEALGLNIAELLYQPHHRSSFQKAAASLLTAGEWSGELNHINKTGDDVVVMSRWTLVRDTHGQPKLILIVETDITEKKRLEAQFMRTQRMESIGVLAGGIAHDLNNVLGPIVLSIGHLKSRIVDESARNVLTAIQASAQRGAEMVKQVLTFARGGTERRMLIQPKYLLHEMYKIVYETFPKTIRIHMDVAPRLWTLSGDSTQLHQVFLNLCVNARDAMPNGGTLSMSVETVLVDEQFVRMHQEAKRGPYVVFQFADTGIGIEPSHLDKIFEPFFTTKEFGKGSGLGLSTAHGIVKNHDGFIRVQSAIGKGTTFWVYLPATMTDELVRTELQQRIMIPGNGECVLVVDDEPAVREVTRETLTHRGYRVITANDGTEALALFAQRKEPVDVVLTDMMMPYLDGAATIKALRRIDPNAKIIASSGVPAFDQGSDRLSTVNAVLLKPYTAEELLETLHTVLHPEPALDPSVRHQQR